jgi:hypothetical protein
VPGGGVGERAVLTIVLDVARARYDAPAGEPTVAMASRGRSGRVTAAEAYRGSRDQAAGYASRPGVVAGVDQRIVRRHGDVRQRHPPPASVTVPAPGPGC